MENQPCPVIRGQDEWMDGSIISWKLATVQPIAATPKITKHKYFED